VTLTSLNLDLSFNSINENCAKYLGEGIAKSITLNSVNLDLGGQTIGKNGA